MIDVGGERVGVSWITLGQRCDGSLGGYASLLLKITDWLAEAEYQLAVDRWREAPMTGVERYGCQLRRRIAAHLTRQLREIAREQNKKIGRRHVSWSNSEGRPVDSGE